MSFAGLLINVGQIRRYTSITVDDYGQPVKPWLDHLIPQPCRLSYPKGRQIQRGTEVVPVEAVLFMEDVDVTEHDRVIVDGITFEILFVARLQDGVASHHLELSLARVIP